MRCSPICAFVAAIAIQTPAINGSGVPTETEIKEQLPAAARQYSERLRDYQCDVVTRVISRTKGSESTIRVEWRQRDGCGILQSVPDSSAGRDIELHVYGEKYSFHCLKRDQAGPWVLVKLNSPLPPTTPETYASGDNVRISWTPYHLGRYRLPELLGRAEFQITRIVPLRHDNRELLRIEFSFPPSQTNRPKGSGYFITDPANYWILTESTLVETSPRSTLTTVMKREFREIESLPLVSRTVVDKTTTMKGMEAGALEISDVTFERKQVPLEQFRLSAFGLPELEGVTWAKPSKRYWWLIVGGIALVGVSALIFWRARRGKPSSLS